MRILLVHSRYRSVAPSGENTVVDQESLLLSEAGHQVDMFQRCSDDIAAWGPARKAALPAQSVWNAQVKKEIKDKLSEFRPDVVHVHNTFPLISASVLHACRDFEVPVVATIHNSRLLCASGDFFRDGSPCHDCNDGRLMPAMRHGCYRNSRLATAPVVGALALNRPAWKHLVSAYIFVSAPHRELMGGLDLPQERVFIKHNSVRAIPYQGSAPREHLVAYLGRLDAAKGLPFLMASWDAFREANPSSSLRLVVAGDGPLAERVRAWAIEADSVQYVGLLPRHEAATLLQHALAAIIPSQVEETFGLVAAEAMSAGVAPIAPRHGSFPDLISDGTDGTLFTPHDSRELVNALQEVDRQPDHYIAYGRRGRVTYATRFAPEVILDRLLHIYRFAIAHPVIFRPPSDSDRRSL